MSVPYQKYDPDLFQLQRASAVSSKLGEFVLGVSKLGGPDTTVWVTVPAATVSLNWNYSISDNYNRTLLLDADTANVSISFWDTLGDVVYPGDRCRVLYDGVVKFLGTVVDTDVVYETDPDAQAHGATRRVDFSASLSGTYTTALSKTVYWQALPEEPALTRIARWVDIDPGSVLVQVGENMPAQDEPGSATILDLIREFSAATYTPVRLTGARAIEVVDITTLGAGFVQADADGMYHGTRRKAQAGLSELALEQGNLLVTVDADLITDDVRLFASSWQAPGPLPVYSLEPAPVRRISYTFSPHGCSGSVEFHFDEIPLSIRR